MEVRPELLPRAGRCGGESEQEAAALAGCALGPDAASVLLHNAAAKRQSQAGAAQGAGV